MRPINLIVIHCSASPNGRWETTADIDAWHRERGFARAHAFRERQNPGLTSIGYHFVIYTNGALATGRHLDEVGAHAYGYNQKSIGVCMVGTDQFTPAAWDMLQKNITSLSTMFPNAGIVGHRDLPSVRKTCPGFDVKTWLKGEMAPLAGHVLEVNA